MKYDIFVSYSRADIDAVTRIVNDIHTQTNAKCWIDWKGIESGDEFVDVIIRAIDSVDTVVFMLSANAMDSYFVKKEIEYARNTGKKIIPVVLDGGKLRGWFLFQFGNVDYTDISKPLEYNKLLDNLKKWYGASSNNTSTNNTTPKTPDVPNNMSARELSKLGYKYYAGDGVAQSHTEALKLFRKSAEMGDAYGEYYLGLYYEKGYGIAQDYSEAVKWYRKAAENDYGFAYNKLGIFYGTGRGVTKDYNEAVKWYRKAAEKGSSAGQYNLALYYEKGYGVAQDYGEALKWYRKAAESGDEDAPKKVEELTAKLAAESKSAKTYKVGDYYNENGKEGVVFEVWDGGRHGKIVSLDIGYSSVWDSRVKFVSKKKLFGPDIGWVNGSRTYADSESDGKANTDKIMSRSDSKYFKACVWCRNKGADWYLPACDELKMIYNNKDVLNAAGARIDGHEWLWASTEYSTNPEYWACYIEMHNGHICDRAKNSSIWARAVATF